MVRLFDRLDTLRPQIKQAARLLIFLDFDGTLAPIVDFPEDAEMPEPTRAVLAKMTQAPEFVVSLISGRSIRDLSRRAAVSPVILAGNHGLEIHGPGIEFIDLEAVALGPMTSTLRRALQARLLPIEGVEVEDKNLSLSIHFRRSPGSREAILVALSELVDRQLFRVREGEMVAEVLPRVDTNKGTAMRYIRAAREEPGDLIVCAGDDSTDEDLFAAANGGITIRVGDAAETAADYFVESTDQLRTFLFWLTEVKAPVAYRDGRHGQ